MNISDKLNLEKIVSISVTGPNPFFNTEIAHEILDRLNRLGYSCSLSDGKYSESCGKLHSEGSVNIKTFLAKGDFLKCTQ